MYFEKVNKDIIFNGLNVTRLCETNGTMDGARQSTARTKIQARPTLEEGTKPWNPASTNATKNRSLLVNAFEITSLFKNVIYRRVYVLLLR